MSRAKGGRSIVGALFEERPSETDTRRSDEEFRERTFAKLKLFFEPYPEYRIMLGETAPEPVRLLTVTRRSKRITRQFVVMVDPRMLERAHADWTVPTLLRFIRALTKGGESIAELQKQDPWFAKLCTLTASIPGFETTKKLQPADPNEPAVLIQPAVLEPRRPADLRESPLSDHSEHQALFHLWARLVQNYFPEQLDLCSYRVVWSFRRHTTTLASCHPVKRWVRVAAIMRDERAQPFLEPLLYHELCHAALGPIKKVNGRRVVHGREFKTLEKRHPGIPALNAWIAQGGWRTLVLEDRRRRRSENSLVRKLFGRRAR